MKFREYIRDHLFIVVMEMIAVIICNIFMGAFKVQAGLCAAVMEMLVQCRENKMILLPAIPRQFETGTVRGIHTRLGASVDMMWKRGRVTHCRITPKETMDVVLIANNEDRPLHLDSGKTIEISFSNIKL